MSSILSGTEAQFRCFAWPEESASRNAVWDSYSCTGDSRRSSYCRETKFGTSRVSRHFRGVAAARPFGNSSRTLLVTPSRRRLGVLLLLWTDPISAGTQDAVSVDGASRGATIIRFFIAEACHLWMKAHPRQIDRSLARPEGFRQYGQDRLNPMRSVPAES